MATEILVNDGGAPARILPFTAGSTVTAGNCVQMGADGQVDNHGGANGKPLGLSLTTVTSGNIASIITGHGVVLNANVTGTVGLGDGVATVAAGNVGVSSAAANSIGYYIDPSGAHSGALSAQQILYLGL
jgi:hypothetical protein